MIKQSMRIIVQNAAKYSNEGSRISLSASFAPDSVAYMVQDEGIGMSERDANHIFERFYRADGARNGGTEGSGLGLSIAKWIVDKHDGHFEVLTRPTLGTRIRIVLGPAKPERTTA
jgi:signal transduction histidine kinase